MTSSPHITVLLAEDHTIVREGLHALLSADGGFTILGDARTGAEAVKLVAKLQPDVILMDIAMPVLNGLEATRQILAANPSARVIVLSAYSDDEYVERMREAGAAGFLEKQTSSEVLTKAIREVAAGRSYYSPSIATRLEAAAGKSDDRRGSLVSASVRLTARESEVLQLVAEGSANKQIAAQLGISIKTVEKHRQHLMDKLNIHDTAGLTRYAISAGVIENSVQLTII
jgi:DNA-binding NarL/FixJ family response regulator